jgi:deazaflavin-dependent oxidoreductase (nitroreductase family)
MRKLGGRRFNRWVSAWSMSRIRRTGKVPGLGLNALVLTTTGRRSGLERSTPVAWFPGPDGTRLIVASALGSSTNTAWYYNLAANPVRARIETAGASIAVVAEQLHGPARAAAWRQITATSPRFAKYQDRMDRLLPVVSLAPAKPPFSAAQEQRGRSLR